MNKLDLAKRISEKSEVKVGDCYKVMEAFLDVLRECFHNNDTLTFSGVGTFKVGTKKERNGVNPSNGKPMRIPERRMLTFSASKHLKQVMELHGK